MNSIRSSLESVDKKNRAQTSALESELDNVINGNEYSKEEKDKIRTLKKSLDDGVTKAREDYSQARKSIPVSTAPALPPGAPAISSR